MEEFSLQLYMAGNTKFLIDVFIIAWMLTGSLSLMYFRAQLDDFMRYVAFDIVNPNAESNTTIGLLVRMLITQVIMAVLLFLWPITLIMMFLAKEEDINV